MSETEQPPEAGSEQFDRCEQCHAPVDKDQRYCVNCGAHQRQVADPAAKYMSRVSAHTGSRGARSTSPVGTVVARSGRGGFGGISLLGALALALIPVAAAVGIAIGRSSNNQDGKLIQALEKQRAQVTTTLVGSSGTAGSSGGSASTSTASKKKTAKKTGAKKSKHASTNSTASGKASKITGTKVTASQQTQGSSEAKKIQSSTGKNYVQAANNLPSSVVVGP